MIRVQFAGEDNVVVETFDADEFVFDGDFVLLMNEGKNVAAVRAERVQYMKFEDAPAQPRVTPPIAADFPQPWKAIRVGPKLPTGKA